MKSLGIELHLQKSNSAPRIALLQIDKFVEVVHKSSDFGFSMCKLQASNFRERASFETFFTGFGELSEGSLDGGVSLDHIKRIITRIITGLDMYKID